MSPVDKPDRESRLALDDPSHWNSNSTPSPRPSPGGRGELDARPSAEERKEGHETSASSPPPGVIAADRATTFGSREEAKSDRHEAQRTTTDVRPELPPAAINDRYSTPSPVIQVSDGEMKDGAPRTLARFAASGTPPAAFQPGPGNVVTMDTIPPAPRDGMAAGMPVDPEASRREAEGFANAAWRAATQHWIGRPPATRLRPERRRSAPPRTTVTISGRPRQLAIRRPLLRRSNGRWGFKLPRGAGRL